MAKLKQLQENNLDIFPVTHEDAVLDNNGKSIISKLNEHINNHPGSGSYDDTEIRGLINNKVDKASGKGLSSNDFTDEEKTKLNTLDTSFTEHINNHPDGSSGNKELVFTYTHSSNQIIEIINVTTDGVFTTSTNHNLTVGNIVFFKKKFNSSHLVELFKKNTLFTVSEISDNTFKLSGVDSLSVTNIEYSEIWFEKVSNTWTNRILIAKDIGLDSGNVMIEIYGDIYTTHPLGVGFMFNEDFFKINEIKDASIGTWVAPAMFSSNNLKIYLNSYLKIEISRYVDFSILRNEHVGHYINSSTGTFKSSSNKNMHICTGAFVGPFNTLSIAGYGEYGISNGTNICIYKI